MTLTIENFRA